MTQSSGFALAAALFGAAAGSYPAADPLGVAGVAWSAGEDRADRARGVARRGSGRQNPPAPPSAEERVVTVRQAPPAAPSFEALLTPLLSPAFGIALNLVGDRAEAEDAVQEAALRAFRGFDQFEPGTNFKAWFYRILTNCCFGRHRQKKRRPQTVDLDDVSDLYLYGKTAQAGLHAVSEDPAALVMNKLTAEQVRAALDALPDDFKAVATMFFLEDLAYDEIAEMLGIPIGTVRSRLHRARRMLQKALWHVAEEAGIVQALTAGGDA